MARAQATSAEEAVVNVASAAEAAEESMAAAAGAAMSVGATEKSAEEKHAYLTDHIAEKQNVGKQAAAAEEAAGGEQ